MKWKSIWSVSSCSNKGAEKNEDYHGVCLKEDYQAMILADGIGQAIYPKESSRMVVEYLLENLPPKYSDVRFNLLFRQANQVLVEKANYQKESGYDHDDLYGTTLILVLETERKMTIAYVGNGAIWHMKGNFNNIPANRNIPWNTTNLLNPHSVSRKGKEVLTRFLSDTESVIECTPSVLTFNKDHVFGDFIIACTDGIDSLDQIKIGRNTSGDWIQFNPRLKGLIDVVENYLNSQGDGQSGEELENIVSQDQEANRDQLEDDATIGIILTDTLLTNWKSNGN